MDDLFLPPLYLSFLIKCENQNKMILKPLSFMIIATDSECFLIEIYSHKICLLKVYSSVFFSIFIRLCNHHHSKTEPLHCPKKKPSYPSAVTSSFPSPQQPLISFLTLWICIFWKFHINRITICSLCVWLLSLSIMNVFKTHLCCSIYQNFVPF